MENPQNIPSNFSQEFTTWARRKMYLILAGLGIFLMIVSVVLNYIKTPPPGPKSLFTETNQNFKVKIDIEGAVEHPGIYELANDSRIQDVLITAGGMTPKADRTYLSKNINLSQKVYDGLKIYIPENDEQISNLGSLGNLININAATAEQLDSLPGVGETTAKKIISGRPYQTTSQLLEKHIIGQSVYSKIKDLISTGL